MTKLIIDTPLYSINKTKLSFILLEKETGFIHEAMWIPASWLSQPIPPSRFAVRAHFEREEESEFNGDKSEFPSHDNDYAHFAYPLKEDMRLLSHYATIGQESARLEADNLVIGILKNLWLDDIVKEYENIPKWYA